MQTFLPYSSFERSAEVLDYRRLGKQRVEAYQILCALSDSKYGWQNHPAIRMWRGYDAALIAYYSAVCREWIYVPLDELSSLVLFSLVAMLPIAILITLMG
jgi:hypothetical protein